MDRVSLEDIAAVLSEFRSDVNFFQETALLDEGIIDSLDLIGIVGEIEKRFGVRVDFNHISKSDFNSMKSIQDLVLRLLCASERSA